MRSNHYCSTVPQQVRSTVHVEGQAEPLLLNSATTNSAQLGRTVCSIYIKITITRSACSRCFRDDIRAGRSPCSRCFRDVMLSLSLSPLSVFVFFFLLTLVVLGIVLMIVVPMMLKIVLMMLMIVLIITVSSFMGIVLIMRRILM